VYELYELPFFMLQLAAISPFLGVRSVRFAVSLARARKIKPGNTGEFSRIYVSSHGQQTGHFAAIFLPNNCQKSGHKPEIENPLPLCLSHLAF
jgi:hypothetical protein